MCHGVICAGQTSWGAAEEAHWRQDAMPELHNDNTLWAFTLRASEELHMLDHQHLNDNALYCLLQMGIFDWTGPNTLLNQAQQAVHLSSATMTRCMEAELPFVQTLTILLGC